MGDHFWKSGGRLADGREIIYFGESPEPGRAGLRAQRPLTEAPAQTASPGGPGLDLARAGLRWDAVAAEWVIVAAGRGSLFDVMEAGEYAVGTRVVSRNEHWIAAPGKLKCLAGTESGMGVWINDITPKEAAHELREAR